MARAPRRIPLTVWLLGIPALLCFAGAAAVGVGLGARLNPLLADPATALALVVSGIALALSAGFPLVIARLGEEESSHRQKPRP